MPQSESKVIGGKTYKPGEVITDEELKAIHVLFTTSLTRHADLHYRREFPEQRAAMVLTVTLIDYDKGQS